MQSKYHDGVPDELCQDLNDKLGFGEVGDHVPFDQKKMETALEHPEVKEVVVTKLRKGMIVTLECGTRYKVIAVRQKNGKVTMKPM